jgi:hypothetical protein
MFTQDFQIKNFFGLNSVEIARGRSQKFSITLILTFLLFAIGLCIFKGSVDTSWITGVHQIKKVKNHCFRVLLTWSSYWNKNLFLIFFVYFRIYCLSWSNVRIIGSSKVLANRRGRRLLSPTSGRPSWSKGREPSPGCQHEHQDRGFRILKLLHLWRTP